MKSTNKLIYVHVQLTYTFFFFFSSVVFASGARDGNVMVWDMRCNRRSGHFCQPVNIISNAHAEKLPGTPQPQKKKSRRSASSRPVTVKMTCNKSCVC